MRDYFSSLRSNQLPADNADLLSQRGNGLFQEFGGFQGGGARRGFNGLPIIYDACWDVGVQAVGSFSRLNTWETPNIKTSDGLPSDLANWSWYVQGKYQFLRPGLFAALRYDTLGFKKIDDGSGSGTQVPWDYGVRSWELGLGYYITDQVIAKVVHQLYRTNDPGRAWRPLWGVQLSTSF